MSEYSQQQKQRELHLADLRTMSEEAIKRITDELQAEHQSLVRLRSGAAAQPEYYDTLLAHNERQHKIVNDYLHTRYRRRIAPTAIAKPIAKNTLRAFFVGGAICTLGQVVINLCLLYTNFDLKTASGLGSVAIVALTALLTGLGIYDEVGRFGGAGSMVPISGFANSIVSAAMEFKREGMVYGIGAKIFTVAGPVILYGTIASVLVGLCSYLWGVGA